MSYTSQYPPAYNSTYIKATSKFTSPELDEWHTANPAASLTGSWNYTNWISGNGKATNQRWQIDLGAGAVIKRIYYENSHHNGTNTNTGAKNFTFQGSNSSSAFNDTTYGTDTDWTNLTTSASSFDQHTGSDVADPKYITVTNSTSYRYYAFKFADNWGNAGFMGARRIELQTEDVSAGRTAVSSRNSSGSRNTVSSRSAATSRTAL